MKIIYNPFTRSFDYTLAKASEVSIADAGGYFIGTQVEAALQEVGASIASITDPMLFKGSIALSSDFPTSAAVQIGWFFVIASDVTDNDVSKTNTGLSFKEGEEIAWDGSTWVVVGSRKAANITIADSGGYYTGTDVEAALQEIGVGTTLDSRYLQISNNLSDLNDAPTAISNLGITATATELNYVDGVTSAIQTQLDSKLENINSELLGDLSDVSVASPGSDQVLSWNSDLSVWRARTVADIWGSITGTLSDQTDLQSALDAKQATLVSGTNIKTINSTSLLGSGDISVGGLSAVVDDTTPQLGGNLDANGNKILLADATDALESGDYPLQMTSNLVGVGSAPSTSDGNLVSMWKMDDNGVFPEDTADTNLKGWWKFEDGSGSTLTDTQNGYNGAITGATWNGTGAFNASTDSLAFDGAGDYVSVNDTDDLDAGTGDFSVFWWIKIAASSSAMAILNKKDENSFSSSGWAAYLSGEATGSQYFQVRLGDGTTEINSIDTINAAPNFDDGTWHQLGFTVDRTNDILKLYIDGAQTGADVDISSLTGSVSNSRPLWIGRRLRTSSDLYLTGSVDDLVFYNDLRTSEEVLRDYRKTQTTYVADYVGANHGAITNATFTDPGYFGYTGDDSLSFDGTGDYVNVPDDASLDFGANTDFSISMWVKRATTGIEILIDKRSNSTTGFYFGFSPSDELRLRVNSNDYDATSLTVTDTDWHYVGISVDRDGDLHFYLDNQNQVVSFTNGDVDNSNLLSIGSRSFTQPANEFNGTIDTIVIYNDLRSDAEHLNDYNNGLTSSTYSIEDTNETVGASGKLKSFKNNTVEKAYIAGDGTVNAFALEVSDTGTATASGGAATLNTHKGIITTASLTTASNADYTLTLTNSTIDENSLINVQVANGTNTTEGISVQRVQPSSGQVIIKIRNTHASGALNGTLKIYYNIIN